MKKKFKKKINYPLFDIQHAQHEEFKNKLKDFRKIFETEGITATLVLNIQEKLLDWFKNHIINFR